MAVPLLINLNAGYEDVPEETRFFFPLMTTSAAFVHASDSYLDNVQFRDVSVKSVYVESAEMNPDPSWDGSKREWIDDITHVSTEFVKVEEDYSTEIDLNAGSIDMPTLPNGEIDQSRVIKEIAVLRSNLSEGLLRWQEVTRIKNGAINKAFLYDYFVENGNYYRYALQPITADGVKGPITDFFDTVATFEGMWMLGEKDKQFSFIYDGKVDSFSHNQSRTTIETITGKYPFIVTPSELDYRTFNFSGKLTYQQDIHGLLVRDTYSEAISPNSTIPINFVEVSYGDEGLLNKKTDIGELEESMVMQRIWRNKILEWLKDGKPKILKSEAEGNILVSVSNVTVTPIQTVYGLVADFQCQMTEIGELSEKTLQRYDLRKDVIEKSELLKEKL